jgi:hypothetical protein
VIRQDATSRPVPPTCRRQAGHPPDEAGQGRPQAARRGSLEGPDITGANNGMRKPRRGFLESKEDPTPRRPDRLPKADRSGPVAWARSLWPVALRLVASGRWPPIALAGGLGLVASGRWPPIALAGGLGLVASGRSARAGSKRQAPPTAVLARAVLTDGGGVRRDASLPCFPSRPAGPSITTCR